MKHIGKILCSLAVVVLAAGCLKEDLAECWHVSLYFQYLADGDKDVLAQLGALQNMFINSKDTKKGLEFFETLEDTGFQFTQELDTATNSIKDMTRQQQMAEYAQYYLTGAQKDSTGQILKQIQQGKISELTQQQLDEANAALAKARSQEYQQVNARMKANVQDWNQKGGVSSAGSAAATGIMSLGASVGGSKAGAMLGSLFGESGEVIGMALGTSEGSLLLSCWVLFPLSLILFLVKVKSSLKRRRRNLNPKATNIPRCLMPLHGLLTMMSS